MIGIDTITNETKVWVVGKDGPVELPVIGIIRDWGMDTPTSIILRDVDGLFKKWAPEDVWYTLDELRNHFDN